MPQTQVNALTTIVCQLPELVNQLKIANKLKAWELKYNHRELGPIQNNAIEIDEIMKGE
jgi:hypothetical protein